jgi:hypothetical protein
MTLVAAYAEVCKCRAAHYRSGECGDWREVKTLVWREVSRERWRLFERRRRATRDAHWSDKPPRVVPAPPDAVAAARSSSLQRHGNTTFPTELIAQAGSDHIQIDVAFTGAKGAAKDNAFGTGFQIRVQIVQAKHDVASHRVLKAPAEGDAMSNI